MTVIVWDGKTLATDRMANDGSQKWESSKAWYSKNKDNEVCIVSGVGLLSYIKQLSDWYLKGMQEPVPTIPHGMAQLVVVKADGLYELHYNKLIKRNPPCAFGDAKDMAMGALGMGATSQQAVEVCNNNALQCGKGVELYTLQGGNDE